MNKPQYAELIKALISFEYIFGVVESIECYEVCRNTQETINPNKLLVAFVTIIEKRICAEYDLGILQFPKEPSDERKSETDNDL